MQRFVESLGEPQYRGKQLVQWIHKYGKTNFDDMTNISKKFRAKLMECAEIVVPTVTFENEASDGTYKWLLQLKEGNAIEMVYIPEANRGTLCISSQVGCALNCSFCSTGKQGFNRNLTTAEIIGQLWIAVQSFKVTNVVFMGMGEPLLNYQAVLAASRLMLDDTAYGLSKYRVTLSTSGVIPEMLKLKKDSQMALAVSLHAANDELRNELVPINKRYPLKQLIPLCRDYFESNKRKVMFEYVMLDGVNDEALHAKQLIALLRNVPCKMNLIPFNPFPGSHYKTSSWDKVLRFQKYLVDAGIDTWIRKTRGKDADAACGQLAGEFKDRTGRHARWQRTGRLVPEKSANQ